MELEQTSFAEHPYRKHTVLKLHRFATKNQRMTLYGPHRNFINAACFMTNTKDLMGAWCRLTNRI
jgi:hypothetical protein